VTTRMSAKSQIEEAGNMFADDSGEMSAANFKIVSFFFANMNVLTLSNINRR
jgi:hypothetical protein